MCFYDSIQSLAWFSVYSLMMRRRKKKKFYLSPRISCQVVLKKNILYQADLSGPYLYFRKHQQPSRLVDSTTPAKANCKEHYNLCKHLCLHFACNKTLERTLLYRIHCTLYSRVVCGNFSFDRSEQVN